MLDCSNNYMKGIARKTSTVNQEDIKEIEKLKMEIQICLPFYDYRISAYHADKFF